MLIIVRVLTLDDLLTDDVLTQGLTTAQIAYTDSDSPDVLPLEAALPVQPVLPLGPELRSWSTPAVIVAPPPMTDFPTGQLAVAAHDLVGVLVSVATTIS